eukprot:TRINITY_DN6557_c0_g1_i1.p1 TRINITY_DN6557_c0_g1~~TRINITY_DN6557_c0_g1_i1.p1  ORF type:complete len:140 (-),score=32.31 TRINITY_DN6557_c0_g1_i1:69-488(-)
MSEWRNMDLESQQSRQGVWCAAPTFLFFIPLWAELMNDTWTRANRACDDPGMCALCLFISSVILSFFYIVFGLPYCTLADALCTTIGVVLLPFALCITAIMQLEGDGWVIWGRATLIPRAILATFTFLMCCILRVVAGR